MNRSELIQQIQSKKSYLCIGLDTDVTKIPGHLERSAAGAKQRTQRAHAERDAATRLLADLVATARVAGVSELQEAETRSEARRQADARLADLTAAYAEL